MPLLVIEPQFSFAVKEHLHTTETTYLYTSVYNSYNPVLHMHMGADNEGEATPPHLKMCKGKKYTNINI